MLLELKSSFDNSPVGVVVVDETSISFGLLRIEMVSRGGAGERLRCGEKEWFVTWMAVEIVDLIGQWYSSDVHHLWQQACEIDIRQRKGTSIELVGVSK